MPEPLNKKQEHEQALGTMTTSEFADDLTALLKIRAPLIYLTVNEEKRMLNYFKHLAIARGYRIYKWDCYLGLLDLINEKKEKASTDDIREPEVVLEKIIEQAQQDIKNQEAMTSDGYKGNIYILLDFHRFLQDADAGIERRLKELCNIESMTTVIVTGPSFESTPALENTFAVLDFPYPNEKEISNALWTLVNSDNIQAKLPKLAKVVKQRENDLIDATKGLTLNEAQTAFSKSVVTHKDFDIPTILKEKQQIIRKKGILEFCKSDVSMADVGGLKRIIKWLKQRRSAFHPDAKKYGLKYPRGLMMLGIPGGGKSLICKAAASLYEMPLLRLDFGRLFNSLVGESERAAREATKVAEIIAPCVAAETEIFTIDGQKLTVRDILKLDMDKNLEICSFDPQTYRNSVDTICAVVKQPTKQEMLNICSWFGELSVTLDHKMMIHKNGCFVWVKACNLVEGDLLVVPKRLHREVKPMSLFDCFDGDARFFSSDIWDKYSGSISSISRRSRKYRKSFYIKKNEIDGLDKINLPDEIAIGRGGYMNSSCKIVKFDLGKLYYVLGLIDSDGYLNSNGTGIGFTNTSLYLHRLFSNILRSMFDINVGRYKNPDERSYGLKGLSDDPVFQDCYVSCFSNKVLHTILSYARSQLFVQDNTILKSYLSGYFDGDGCITLDEVKQPRLVFCSKKRDSWKRVRTVLHILGVLSPGFQKGYNVTISSFIDVKKVLDMLTIRHPKKSKKASLVRASIFNHSSRRDRGYSLGSLLKTERKQLGIMSNTFLCFASHISGIENYDKLISEDKMLTISQRMEDNNEIQKIFNSDVIGVKIKQIKRIGKRDCYDLMVKNNHNFYANGFLSKNCILWLDELEKALSGARSSGQTDGGTTSRVVSTFLTWLQEKTQPVFVMCTANDYSQIPPEFTRAGRFDEVFFVDLPDLDERVQIFEVLLRRFGRDSKTFDAKKLAGVSDGYTGAEIEKAIESALFVGFNDGKREITTKDISKAIESFKPLSETRGDVFDEMRAWAANFCVLANGSDDKGKADIASRKKSVNIDLT